MRAVTLVKRSLAAVAFAAIATVGLSSCAAPEVIAVSDDVVIVDVRTAGEYSAGHLDEAVNVDVQAADFEQQLAALPLDGAYVVYCASGNRSASAVDRMEDLGFTDVTDAGGIDSASDATGIPIVN